MTDCRWVKILHTRTEYRERIPCWNDAKYGYAEPEQIFVMVMERSRVGLHHAGTELDGVHNSGTE